MTHFLTGAAALNHDRWIDRHPLILLSRLLLRKFVVDLEPNTRVLRHSRTPRRVETSGNIAEMQSIIKLCAEACQERTTHDTICVLVTHRIDVLSYR